MSYAGIDYGLTTGTNRNAETGIHYGVISQNSVLQAWADSAEPDYGKPTCPKCGNNVVDYDDDKHGEYEGHGCCDYACESCERYYESGDAYGEEPIGWNYEGDGYILTDCLGNDIFVIDSPFYTFTGFCSPCVPGAGDLDSPVDDGAKTYCLGHDWFDSGEAPYTVYSVATGEIVRP